jgi:ATP-binding protein involved in chromosome partitioning
MLKVTDRVKYIIAIASGKGGVGKSTTAINLALALAAKKGVRVGLLDADIYGPNQPQMLGVNEKPISKDGKTLEPVYAHGIQSMSIGYLIDINTPMVWRGPMVTGALQQLLNDTHWDNLEYLIVDLPPGTGDIQLTLTQKIPLSGAVIVTTPQDIALLDVRKAVAMFNKVKVPLLGVVENMCTHVCSQCGYEEPIFGEGGGGRIAKECGVDLLGALPLDSRIRKQADSGKPIFLVDAEGPIAKIYRDIADKIEQQLAIQPKDRPRFPRIVIEKK